MLLAALGAGSVAASTGWAQQQVQGGRGLDANPQAGSGGINPHAPMIDYAARNDLVTGNAGFSSFRGPVGYRAPGEFTGSLSSDSLYRFHASTLSTEPLGGGAQQPGAVPRVLYRDFSSPVGQHPQGGAVVSDVGGRVLDPQTGTWRQETPARTAPVSQGAGLWAGAGPEGLVQEIELSPLTGVRVRPLQPEVGAAMVGRHLPWEVDAEAVMTAAGEPEADAGLALLIGRELNPRIVGQGPDADAAADRLARIDAQIFAPLGGATVPPGQDVYYAVLAALRGEAAPEGMRLEPLEEPADARPAAADQVVVPSEEQLRAAEQQVAQQAEGGAAAVAPEAAEQLFSRIGRELPRVGALSRDRDQPVSQRLARGIELLQQGKFFEAESLYRDLAAEQPDNPMIRIGLIHSQLAAGLFRSAAYGLRQLFEEHPELIGLRFAGALLPPAERLVYLSETLQEMIVEKQGSLADAGLVQAYLGYQLEQPAMTRFGLLTLEAAAPRDPLLPVLGRLWAPPGARVTLPETSPEMK